MNKESEIARITRLRRGQEILKQQTGKAVRPYREDGYINLMNKYGTSQDNSEGYQYQKEPLVPDIQFTNMYESNGLFAKIIDTPAEEALKHGFELGLNDPDIESFVEDALDELDWEEKAATAIKWARLYGGSIIVMLIDDGCGLEEPVNWKKVKSIDELRVFERAVLQPDYSSLYTYDNGSARGNRTSRFGKPEYYDVLSVYGSFRVHESRCLVFRNGVLPERVTNPVYQLWGIPEYVRVRRALQETIVAHQDGTKLLERSVQAIYKMKGLASLLSTDDGEDQVLKRLQLIDMARGMLNSISIDSEGEDYDFKTFQFTGIKDVIDATCNMLSAITSIPQRVLFGRGTSGLSNTDDTSMEMYYNYIERIQKLMLRRNLRSLLDVVFRAGISSREIEKEPQYKLQFKPLWNLSEKEQADVDKAKADTQYVKAQTAQLYVDMQALDPSEVRKGLSGSEDFDIEDLIEEEDEDFLNAFSDPALESDIEASQKTAEASAAPGGSEQTAPSNGNNAEHGQLDSDVQPARKPAHGDGIVNGVGVLVAKDGQILTGIRRNEGTFCGPGGHIESGETPEQAAIRETQEEFGITPTELIPLGTVDGMPDEYGAPHLFLCTEYTGEPQADGNEMTDAAFMGHALLLELAEDEKLFEPFHRSIQMLLSCIGDSEKTYDQSTDFTLTSDSASSTINEKDTTTDGGSGSGNFGHKGVPGQAGGSAPSGSAKELTDAIASGTISTKLDSKKQSKHRTGSSAYQKAIAQGKKVSVITANDTEIQSLLDSYSGKGHAYSYNGQFKETFEHTSPIGIHVSASGKESETRRGTIHYSKSGAHIVPASPKGGSK